MNANDRYTDSILFTFISVVILIIIAGSSVVVIGRAVDKTDHVVTKKASYYPGDEVGVLSSDDTVTYRGVRNNVITFDYTGGENVVLVYSDGMSVTVGNYNMSDIRVNYTDGTRIDCQLTYTDWDGDTLCWGFILAVVTWVVVSALVINMVRAGYYLSDRAKRRALERQNSSGGRSPEEQTEIDERQSNDIAELQRTVRRLERELWVANHTIEELNARKPAPEIPKTAPVVETSEFDRIVER